LAELEEETEELLLLPSLSSLPAIPVVVVANPNRVAAASVGEDVEAALP
jgi:hypothetical protein